MTTVNSALPVGNGAMHKFGNCFQWRGKLFIFKMLFFSIGNGAMNPPQYWQRRTKPSSLLTTALICLLIHHFFPIPTAL
jgi:hypothetical protein